MLAVLTVLFVCIYGSVCIYQTGATPLYIAAQEGHEAAVSALLAAGADKNLQKKVRFVAAAAADYDNALHAVNSAALAAVIRVAILCAKHVHQFCVGIYII